MTPLDIGFLMIGAMLLLIVLGTHIGIALAVLSFTGVWWIKGNAVIASKLLALTATDFLANYFFGVVPLFVLMALVVNVSGIGRDTFDVAQRYLGRIRGGLGIATVAANAVFAAITGISVASAAMFTKVAVPEMVRLGYSPKFAVGTVAGSSVLGMLIPPSLLLIIYGILTESSISDLFLAGIGPGVLLALAFMVGVFLMAVFWPSFVGDGVHSNGANPQESIVSSLRKLERVRHRQNQKGDSQGSQKVIQAMSWVKGGQPWMTRPYSEDLRERVVRVVESGTSRNAAAKQFDVSISFVVKLMQRWKQRGTIKADKYGGWKKSNLAPHGDRIRALVMENCDITIDELCVLLAAEGIEAKRSTLGDFLLAQGLSRKKRQPTPPSRSALTSRRREPLGATSNLG